VEHVNWQPFAGGVGLERVQRGWRGAGELVVSQQSMEDEPYEVVLIRVSVR
jgi:hypothetical protein